MKFSITFKYSNVTFKNKENKETVTFDSKAEGNTFTFDNVDEDVVLGIVKGIKDRKASQVFAFDNLRTNFVNVIARNKCKELYDKLDKGGWKVEDVAISNVTIKDLEFTKPTMNARETLTVESISKKNYPKGGYPTWVVKERLVDLIEGVPRDNPMWADLVDILEKYYGSMDVEKLVGESKEEVEVEFKKTPDDGTVIAFFPQTMHDGSCNPGNIMSYEHNGQHGEASIDFYHDCTTCPEEDYADLLAELEKVYDDCELIVVD
jgi:hypothetical protein